MSESDAYKSIKSSSRGIYREKGSKFLGYAIPVTTEDQIKEALASLKKEQYQANHHCYAYRIGYPEFKYRINDDGEPSGSAGKPIYGQILSHDLYDLLIVVIRYFGGTKLGIPGLIRSYKTATRDALNEATIITKICTENITINFPYPQLNDVMRILKQIDATFLNQTYDETCTLDFSIRQSSVEHAKNRLLELPNISILNP
jgi:uncharacterized YigZ family protein